MGQAMTLYPRVDVLLGPVHRVQMPTAPRLVQALGG